jgi:predicted nucleic acid-binding protein
MVFDEVRAEEARSPLEDAELYEPVLLAYELASTARKKARAYPQQRAGLLQALRLGLAIPMNWVSVDHIAVFRLSLGTGLTTYDASYLHIARALGIPLVTFDQHLERASTSGA